MPSSILLSSAGRRVALLRIFQAHLRNIDPRHEVLATDASPLAAAYQAADRHLRVPPVSDPRFLTRMLEICADNQVVLLVPTIDTELPLYAMNRGAFQSVGTTVAISAPRTVSISADKRSTHDFLCEHGFPTVDQAPAIEVASGRLPWRFPTFIKPPDGSASVGVRRVTTMEVLRGLLDESQRADLLVQSIAAGDEYTVDVLVGRDGSCLDAIARRRLEVRAGEVSKAVTVRSRPVLDLARNIAEALPGAFGVLNIQIFFDSTTRALSAIEINPRFGGGYPLSEAAGAHYTKWLVDGAFGRPIALPDGRWQDGLTMLRYDDAVFVEGLA